jgi:hypothetical protein
MCTAGCVTKRRKGETKEGEGKEAGKREAHARNRAALATQADAEHSGGSKSHTGAQTNLNKEEGRIAPRAAIRILSPVPIPMDVAAGRQGVQAKIEVTFLCPIVPPCALDISMIHPRGPTCVAAASRTDKFRCCRFKQQAQILCPCRKSAPRSHFCPCER